MLRRASTSALMLERRCCCTVRTAKALGRLGGLVPHRHLHQFEDSARPLPLRNYQEQCIESVLKAFEEGRRKVGVSLATGGGKTVIFTELIGRVSPPKPGATQTLILVHRRELVQQAMRHCIKRYPDASVEMELGNARASGKADITVASIQSINSLKRIEKFDPNKFKLVLVDEAHHIVAETYMRALAHFQLLTDDHTPSLVGVSATFSRHDGVALQKAIEHIVYHKDYVDMIDEQWLSDVVFTSVTSGADLSQVRKNKATGDFHTRSLSAAVNQAATNEVTVRAWLAKAAGRRSTLVFCIDVAHLEDLAATFRAHGFDARTVTAATRHDVRSAIIDAFKAGEFPVLLNCGVFTEGTDIPNIDCVLLARPTRSRNLLVQMIGRGMRRHLGKTNCHVLDMVASLEDGIVTAPTLFGLDASELVESASPTDLRERRLRLNSPAVGSGAGNPRTPDPGTSDINVRFTDYDSVTDLIADTSGDRHVRAISPHAWVSVSDTKYVLTNGREGSQLVLEHTASPETTGDDDLPQWTVKHMVPSAGVANTRAPYLRPRIIGNGSTFEAAVRAADTFAAAHFVRSLVLVRGPAAQWREGPATTAQLAALQRVVPAGESFDGEGLTKGEAGDMLTRIKHGAKGTWRALQAVKARHDRRLKKEEKLKGKMEAIGVGPVLGHDHGDEERISDGEHEAQRM